jgi:hypothetical protein
LAALVSAKIVLARAMADASSAVAVMASCCVALHTQTKWAFAADFSFQTVNLFGAVLMVLSGARNA